MKTKPDNRAVLQAVLNLANSCHYEKEHSQQVTKLALNLFDELQSLHKLGKQERFLLRCAGLLHDIGWVKGQIKHHKTAMNIIMNSHDLPFTDTQRKIVALTARYHRRALPKDTHLVFLQLSAKEKTLIKILAGILRTADGLDRTHTSVIEKIKCDVKDKEIIVKCKARGPVAAELAAAAKKADLLAAALGRDIRIVTERS
jgi:exopolyphosphatase/guanosine-5'-triphosphate,3'-diphosphate pyrophosphatase